MSFQVKKEISKTNIIEDFNYYDLLALENILLRNGLTLHSTRNDLEAKKLQPVRRNGELGVIQFGVFYSEKQLLKEVEKVEMISDVVINLLKLKEMEPGFTERSLENTPLETKMQFYAEDYKQHWKIIYDEEKFFLVRVDDIPVKPIYWGD